MMAIILLFLVTGCGKAGQAGNPVHPGGETGDGTAWRGDVVSWQESYHRLEKRYDLALAADCLYGCYFRDGQAFLDVIDREGFSVKETLALPDATYVGGMAAGPDGNIYLLGRKGEGMVLWRIGAGGDLQNLAETELEDADGADDLSLRGIRADQKGNLFVWCKMNVPSTTMKEGEEFARSYHWEDRVYVTDGKRKTIFYEKIEDVAGTEVLSFQMGRGGEPVFLVRDSDGAYLQEMDVERKGLRDAVRLEKSGEFFDAAYVGGTGDAVPVGDDGFLYCLDNEIHEYHYGTQKAERKLSLSTYGIRATDVLCLSINRDALELIENHGDFEYSEFVSLAPGESEKKTVTLGVIMTPQDLEKAVAEFNRYSNAYRVEIVDYCSQAESYEEGKERLTLDVIAKKAPDVISVGSMNYGAFADKGVLADLYEFMGKDEEFQKGALVRSVAEAYENGGHLYAMAPSFLLHSMWGYRDVTGGRSGVTFRELFRLLEESGTDFNAISGFAADEPVLTRLCTVSMDEFVDWENRTCEFDGEYFKEVLAFAKEYVGNYAGGTYSERIRSREVVMSVGILSSVTDYQIQKELYGGDVGFIGYPTAEGNGTAIGFFNSAVAINATNDNQEGAWEFVKYYLLHGYDGWGFPVVQRQFDQVMAEAMEEECYEAEDGGTARAYKDSYQEYDANGNSHFFGVYAATQEEVDAVVRLVEGAKNKLGYHGDIQNIIDEEAAAYFSGQVDLDKTAEKIQNRVALLLKE